jgi:hypothetical protein
MFYDIEENFIFVQISLKRMILIKRITHQVQS